MRIGYSHSSLGWQTPYGSGMVWQNLTMSKSDLKPSEVLEAQFESWLLDLIELSKIPSVSFPGFDPKNVLKSAQVVADLMRRVGLQNVELLEIPGAHPYVYGDWLHAPGKPTVLLYAHHDVQPPGRTELWKSDPFVPEFRDGPGGRRLYGRGAADDKAGVVMHLSTIDAFLKSRGDLPVNVKVVIEGEEEIGSTHLESFLGTFKSKLKADVMILADAANFDVGVPALTIALRGLLDFEVEVRALSKTVHSGMWGGPVPDPAMALSKMLSTLVDQDGQIAIPGVMDDFKELSADEMEKLAKIPTDRKKFRIQSGMVETAQFMPPPKKVSNLSPETQVWRAPSLTVNAIQASSRAQAGNVINDQAWAKFTIRLAKGMDPEKVRSQVESYLKGIVPWGLELKLVGERGSGPWMEEPKGPVFEMALRSLRQGYGKEPILTGCGGSIPFVAPFAVANEGAPALLVGVEDPYTDAHGENESLQIEDFKKACISQVLFFEELGK